jgi:putative ABC transport system ATP-binding protein
LLEALGLAAVAGRRPGTLSGGEEHRAAVARALVHGPSVVFADEPTGSLDGVSGRAVAEALATLARERRVAVLVATHDARLRAFAARRLWMVDGELREGSLPD